MTLNPASSTTNVASPMPARKVAFAALHHRNYRRYFFVIMLSQMGDNIEHVISYWLLYQKFHSPCSPVSQSSVTGRRSCFLRFISARSPIDTMVDA